MTTNLTNVSLNGTVTLTGPATLTQTITLTADQEAQLVAQGWTAPNVVPPIPPQNPTIGTMPLNLSALVCLRSQYSDSRYERFQHHLVLTGDAISLPFGSTNIAAGGTRIPFAYPKYGLQFNGVERATYTRVGAETGGTFTGSLVDEQDGPILTQIVAYDASGTQVASTTECLMQFWVWIDRTGNAKKAPDVIYQYNSYDWLHSPTLHVWARVPKSLLGNVPIPLTPRVPVPFSTAIPKEQITRVDRIPTEKYELHHPCVTSRGITVTDNMQAYFFTGMSDVDSLLPLLDGPRGVNTVAMTLFMRMGRNQKIYGTSAQSWWVVDGTGAKRTLVGKRHTQAPYWEEAAGNPLTETVGIWDASIPAAERFPWACWGQCWDERTLALDPNAAPIGGEQPHIMPGPVAFLSDKHGYVLKVQFVGNDHLAPPTITRFIAVTDPWGLAYDSGNLYVAERGKHRISQYDATTGAFIRDVVANPNGASLTMPAYKNDIKRIPGVTTIQTFPVVSPELIEVQDGYLYYGSLAMQEVRRVNLATGVIDTVCRPPFDDNSHFLSFALSDGTFGPRGTVATTTFSLGNFGRPVLFLPVAGTGTDGVPLTNSQSWWWAGYGPYIPQGAGGLTSSSDYAIACAIGQGMMACANSNMGIQTFMQIDHTLDTAWDATKCEAGATYLNTRQDTMLLGYNGFTRTALPLPWGADPNCDYFLTACGHVKP